MSKALHATPSAYPSEMTRAVQYQSPLPDNVSVHPAEKPDFQKSHPESLNPIGDCASDGDAGERPVREKLKKTSIATIPKYGITSVQMGAEEHADMLMKSQSEEENEAPGQYHREPSLERRGRAVRKRSLDDFDAVDTSKGTPTETTTEKHIRKRSRDVRSGSSINSGSRRRSPEVPVQEESEDLVSGRQATGLATGLRQDCGETTIQEGISKPVLEAADHEMQESVLSPKKKRSRDQLELESQREQKIAATDENRARRRSSEEERRNISETEPSKADIDEQSTPNGHTVAPKDDSRKVQIEGSVSKEPLVSGFRNTSTTSPFAAFGSSVSIFGSTPALSGRSVNQQTQTASSAFASSGFAAQAVSSASPFQTTTGISTSSSKTISPVLPPRAPNLLFATSGTGEASGFGNFQNGASSGFGSGKTTTFTASNASGFPSLRGSTFAGGFTSAFGGGQKLTSFAAPIGDINPLAPKAKAIGGSNPSDNEDSGSEEGESNGGEAEHERDEEITRYQIHDVDTGEEGENTIFQTRAKLFEYQEGTWAERGMGTFKLNVTAQDLEKKDDNGVSRARARFVMRATATHKVMLNAPIFKEMNIKEMAGNKIVFSVPLKGKVIPYILRMGKEEDIKIIHREVQRLQKEM